MVAGPLLVPPQRSPIAGGNGQAPNEWYEFFRRLLAYLQETGVDPAVIADILARLDALEADAFGPFLILGPLSVQVQGTPAAGNVLVQLENDEAAPAAHFYYGTDPTGAKGFYPAADLSIYLVDENGNYLVDESGNFLTDGPPDNHSALNNLQDAPSPVDGEHYHLSSIQATRTAAMAAGGTSALFWRGDFTYTNTLAGPFTAQGQITASTGPLVQSGNTTTASLLSINGTMQNTGTTQQQIASFQTPVQPQGATLGTLYGLLFLPQLTGGSAAISTVECVFARVDSTGGFTGSIGTVIGVHAANPSLNVASSGYIGMLCDNVTTASSSTRALDLRINTGTGTKHNVYAQGTAPNYFRGNVGVNTTSAFGSGDGVLALGNAVTAPTTAPTGAVDLFAESGSFKGMFPDGRVQTIAATGSKIITVYTLSDLPAASGGVITLADNTSYYITAAIDLLGARIQCGLNNSLHGDDADNCSLTSTGLSAATAFITSTSSLSLQSITIKDVGTALSLNDSTNQLAWRNIRFQNIPTMGTIQNYANIVWGQCILDNSANLTIQGTVGSIAFFECLFDGRTGQTTLTVPAAAVITRRLRMLYCAVACLPGETAFNVSASATIPDEGYILDNVAFAGGGTYLAGLDYTSNKALFFNSTGIQNTSVLCQYSMTANATATVIGATGTFVKIAGTTTASSLNQKFTTGTTQRATYAGVGTANFRVVAFASMTSGNNQVLRMRVAKNGTTISESNTLFKTTGTGEASAVGCQVIVTMAPTDYIELFVANDTAATNVTVSDLNLTVTRL